jgi:UDP-N-acetylmuramoyl-tripeptide--D-alanyl-D-alanine ligase
MMIEQLYDVYTKHPNVQTDTRKLRKGDIYFALKGENFNGNKFVKEALDKGAAYCVIDEQAFAVEGKTFLVENVLDTLQQLARHHRKQFLQNNIPFIAITGSNGKTTTKELAHAVLSSQYKTYTTEGNLNNHIGVPLTILKIRNDAEFAVIEMGANHLGEIASYCKVAQPTHGLITNCGKAHLEGFGSEEGVKKGKGELFDYLRANSGTAFIMNDYDYLQEMSKGIKEVYRYGTTEGDVTGRTKVSQPFLSVEFEKGISGVVQTQLVGDYNLPNVLAAAAIGHYFKSGFENIKASIESYLPSNSRSQLIEKNGNKIILDAYNANPSSMKLAIDNFALMKEENKILTLGAMAELGAGSISEHEMILEQIGNHKWKDVILVGGDFLKIKNPWHSFPTADEAGKWLALQNYKNSALLIKGSRSAQMERILNYLND